MTEYKGYEVEEKIGCCFIWEPSSLRLIHKCGTVKEAYHVIDELVENENEN